MSVLLQAVLKLDDETSVVVHCRSEDAAVMAKVIPQAEKVLHLRRVSIELSPKYLPSTIM